MSVNAFSVQPRRVNFDWINESFQLFLRDAWVWVLALIIQFVCSSLVGLGIEEAFVLTGHSMTQTAPVTPSFTPSAILSMYTMAYWICLGLSSVAGIPIGAFFLGGLYRMANKSVAGERLSVGDLFSGGPTILTFSIFYVAFALAFDISFVGGLIFGGFVICALLLPAYSLLAEGESLGSAISKSYNAMKGDWLRATGFAFVFTIIVFASYLCCCLPILVTFPMCLIATAIVRREMIPVEGQAQLSSVGVWPPPPNFNIPAKGGVWPPPQSVESKQFVVPEQPAETESNEEVQSEEKKPE